mmetsp:Transcript_29100/g.65132  ORF Transcript_29100/g.65132 Transcript_29100/m.65132 type:complete len:542 (+) Transcript_29100:41-1666(+)|eukprot:CAMPEP_0172584756 /NCGR_PEP_ID=MMETSP1068-20121228/4353_1 /TAXON_ID=35684 /ORGANISM="Pseudopedinella elastica, Strain CCMP716" /LENGTH=541 /DNA_ID=CAMNT_0013379047 /DNA_START=36 /DNA_END=1661 /DNA_ORIENTATION=-
MSTATFTASDGTAFTNRSEYRKYEFQLSYTFTGKENQHNLVKLPGSVDCQPFDIANLKNCTAVVMDATDQVQIDEVEGSKIFLGATGESVFVRNCKDTVFYVACKQLRTRECNNCTFYLYCISEPIIEMSTGVKFGCFNGGYPEQALHMEQAGLDPRVNKWSMIFDFNDEAKTGKNWTVLPAAEYKDSPWFPAGAECERAVPLLEGGVAAAQAYKLVPPEEGSGLTFSFNTSQDAAEEAFAQVEAETEAANPPPAPEASAPEVAPTGGPPAAPPAPAAAVPPAPPAPTEEDPLKDAFKVGTKVEARYGKGPTWYLAVVRAVRNQPQLGPKYDLDYLDGSKEDNVLAKFVQLPAKRTVGWNPDRAKASVEKNASAGSPAKTALGSDPECGVRLRKLMEEEDAAAATVAATPEAAATAEAPAAEEDWKAAVGELEAAAGGPVLTAEAPGEWAGKEAKHVPSVSVSENKKECTVTMGHGMDADHFIQYIWAKNQAGEVIAGIKLSPGEGTKAELKFSIPEGTTTVSAYEACNLHGVWSSSAISL